MNPTLGAHMDDSVSREKALIVYELTSEFLRCLENGQLGSLRQDFQINDEVFAEINDALSSYGKNSKGWTLPPKNLAFSGNLRVFEIFQMDDPAKVGIESSLWLSAQEQEPIIHAEADFSGAKVVFRYRYIGS